MFLKQNQPNVDEAREAVKKQLLLSLMQQVVDEVQSMDKADIDEMISSMMSEVNVDPLRERANAIASAAAQSQIEGLNLDEMLESYSQDISETAKAEFEAGIKQVVSDIKIDLDPDMLNQHVQDKIATVLKERMGELDLDAEISGEKEKAIQTVEQDMTSRLDTQLTDFIHAKEISVDLEKIDRLMESKIEEAIERHLSNINVDEMIEARQKNAVDTLHALVSTKLESIAPTVSTEIQDQVEESFSSIAVNIGQQVEEHIQEKVSATIVSQVAEIDIAQIVETQRVDAASNLTEQAESALEHVAPDITREVLEGISGTVAEVSKTATEQVDAEIANQTDVIRAELKVATSEKLASNLDQIRQDVVQMVSSDIVSDEDMAISLAERTSEAILRDMDWNETVSQRVMDRLAEQLGQDVQQRVRKSDTVIQESVERMRNESDLFDSISSRVREELIEQVARLSLAQLDDVDTIAREARDHIAFDNDSLIAAAAMLRTKILQDIARRTTLSLGNTEDVSQESRPWINEEDPYVMQATSEVVKTAHEVIATLARQQISDTDFVVGRISPDFTADTLQIKNAVKATRKRLTEKIADFTTEELRDIDTVSKQAASEIPEDHDAITNAIRATVSLLLDDVVRGVELRLKWTEKMSSDARTRMSDEIPEVNQAADVLENILLSEVAANATQRLYEVDRSSDRAREFVEADKQLTKIQKGLLDSLLKEVAQSTVQEMNQTEQASLAAFEHVDLNHTVILTAIEELRSKLIAEIATSASRSMEDTEAVTKESKRLISGSTAGMTKATEKVYNLLIEDVARDTITQISDTDKTAEDAFSRVQSENEVIARVRSIVHDRMIESLLGNALSEIGKKVAGTSTEDERAFFKNAIGTLGSSPFDQDAPLEPQPTETPAELDEASDDVNESEAHAEPATPEEPAISQTEIDQVDWKSLSEIDPETTAPEVEPSTPRSWTIDEFRPNSTPGDGASGDTEDVEASFPFSSSDERSFYLYGIVSTGTVNGAVFDGMEGLENGSSIFSVSCGELSAIVSEMSDPAFSPFQIRSSMRDNEWLKEKVRSHAGVLAEAKQTMTIVPLRFGTVFSTEPEIRDFVLNSESKLIDALSRLKDKSEFGVRVGCDMARLEAMCYSSSRDFDIALSQVSSSVAEFVRDTISSDEPQLGVEAMMANFAARIHGALTDISAYAIHKSGDMNSPFEESDVVLNATYLVTIVNEKNFKARIADLATEFAACGISIEVSGPWPPYHFVEIDLDGSSESSLTGIPV